MTTMSKARCIRHHQGAGIWKPNRQRVACVSSRHAQQPISAQLAFLHNQLPKLVGFNRLQARPLTSSGKHDVTTSNKNTSRFYNNKDLQRARVKGELKPLLSLAIQTFLTEKQQRIVPTESTTSRPDFTHAVHLLARWNGYEMIDPSRIVVTRHFQAGKLPLGQGLVAEASPFASENYIVLARPTNAGGRSIQEHPPFVEEDASWYRHLEDRVNDNLERWEEQARKRRQQRLHNAKQGFQRLFDSIQAPAAKTFEAVTIRLGPIIDRARTTLRGGLRGMMQVRNNKLASETEKLSPEGEKDSDEHIPSKNDTEASIARGEWNDTDPEDLIILSKDGSILQLINDVHPSHRLLALPVIHETSSDGKTGGKSKPPYRLRLARGGFVITVSFIMLGAVPPTYRSLRFILDYPKTAEVVMITLVGSMAYSMWSWLSHSRTRQRELIAASIQSRLVARDEAAVAFLTKGAVDQLTDVIMEDYVSRLLSTEGTQHSNVDPLVMEIGCSVGLFRSPKKPRLNTTISNEAKTDVQDGNGIGAIVAVEWEEAREDLLHVLAKRR